MHNDRHRITESEVVSLLVVHIARLRKLPTSAVDPTRSFNSLGIDSLDAVTLVGDVESRFGIQIDMAEIFDYPTPAALARLICMRHQDSREDRPGNGQAVHSP